MAKKLMKVPDKRKMIEETIKEAMNSPAIRKAFFGPVDVLVAFTVPRSEKKRFLSKPLKMHGCEGRLVNKPPDTPKGIVIERGIPIPPPVARTFALDQFPFDSMKVGDSFLVPLDTEGPLKKDQTYPGERERRHPIYPAIHRYEKKQAELGNTIKLVLRKSIEGIRCWREK